MAPPLNRNSTKPFIGAIVLAAGGSRRMGIPKLLLPYQGESLVRKAAKAALMSFCRPIVFVVGALYERMHAEISDLDVQIVENAQWSTGPGSSIRTGLLALEAINKTQAVVLLLGDQPMVTASSIHRIRSAYSATSKLVVASRYNGIFGVPALFDRCMYPELLALDASAGAKQLFEKYAASLQTIAMPEGSEDIDNASDYERLLIRGSRSQRLGFHDIDESAFAPDHECASELETHTFDSRLNA